MFQFTDGCREVEIECTVKLSLIITSPPPKFPTLFFLITVDKLIYFFTHKHKKCIKKKLEKQNFFYTYDWVWQYIWKPAPSVGRVQLLPRDYGKRQCLGERKNAILPHFFFSKCSTNKGQFLFKQKKKQYDQGISPNMHPTLLQPFFQKGSGGHIKNSKI